MRDLQQITVIGLGLLGGSITLAILRFLPAVKVVGYSHRPATRLRARRRGLATKIVDDIGDSVAAADLVILATPIRAFEKTFEAIADALPAGSIVTDVGSTKVLPHRWAGKKLPKTIHYVGSHPIAGSEQRGLEFARADLFDRTTCILTTTRRTNRRAVQILKRFWSTLGCWVKIMSPARHDRILADVSHLPHVAAVALMNAIGSGELKFAGTGLTDTSRVASGPANIWTDVILTNAANTGKSIGKIVAELSRLRTAIERQDDRQIRKLLETARRKREVLISCRTARNKPLP